MTTALTCPFCRGAKLDVYLSGYDVEVANVRCLAKKCGAVGPERKTTKAAVKAWEKSNERRSALIEV